MAPSYTVGKGRRTCAARLRQYVTLTDDRAKIPLMMQLVASFDYIVVESEHEALVLERELIVSVSSVLQRRLQGR